MKIRAFSWLLVAALAWSPAAFAQEGGEGDDTGLGDEPLPDVGGSPVGADENPDAPKTEFTEEKKPEVKKEAAKVVTDYPIEEVARPITLPRFMSEVTLDYSAGQIPVNGDGRFLTNGLLAGAFGVTREAQLGLRYGLGSYAQDAMDNMKYFAGKAVSVDFVYLIQDWVGAQLSVPMYLDPFAFGVTLGAPFKFTFFDKLSLEFGRDLLSFKLRKFVPVVGNSLENDGLAAADAVNTTLPDGEINMTLRAVYQYRENIAFDGRFGFRLIDFDANSDTPYLLDGAVQYSTTNKIDVGGRLGFTRLDEGFDSFLLTVFAALRI